MRILSKEELYALLEKQQQGNCSQEEEKIILEHFDQAPLIEELTFVSEEERESIRKEIIGGIAARTHLELFSTSPVLPATRNKFRRLRLASAAVLAGCLMIFGLQYLLHNKGQEGWLRVAAPLSVHMMPFTLPDHSVVWLYGGCTLTYPVTFANNKRQVILKGGKAFFAVQPDKESPFSVHMPDSVTVRVLGTSFLVATGKVEDRVIVATGKVQFNKGQLQLDILGPRQRLRYTRKQGTFVKDTASAEELMEWEGRDMIRFRNASIGDIAQVLHNLYNVPINYEKDLEDRKFNMSFARNLCLDEIEDLLLKTGGLEFLRKDNHAILIRKK